MLRGFVILVIFGIFSLIYWSPLNISIKMSNDILLTLVYLVLIFDLVFFSLLFCFAAFHEWKIDRVGVKAFVMMALISILSSWLFTPSFSPKPRKINSNNVKPKINSN